MPYLHHEGTELQVWRQAMDLCAGYGVDVLVPEINEPQAWAWQWRVLLQAAALTNDPPVKVGMFFGMYSKDKDAVIASMKKVLGPFREDLRNNPVVNRAGGHPVMVIYIRREMQRGVAQPGSAPGLGPGCRRFESCHPDIRYFKGEHFSLVFTFFMFKH